MTETTPKPQLSRRPYAKPRVRAFGSLTALTRAVGPMGMMDGSNVNGMMMTGA